MQILDMLSMHILIFDNELVFVIKFPLLFICMGHGHTVSSDLKSLYK